MLPSKLFHPATNNSSNRSNNATTTTNTRSPSSLPLGMTGVMCQSSKLEIPGRGLIYYRIFRPRQLKPPNNKPPLILVHGGPLIPCNYLLPLAYVIVDRSIVVYDQLGCGQSGTLFNQEVLYRRNTSSSKPQKNEEEEEQQQPRRHQHLLDIEGMVQDLNKLIEHWKFPKFHLLGHSFGGILIFEYLKYCRRHHRQTELERCSSVIMASVPTSIQLVVQEVQKLCLNLATTTTDFDDDDDDDDGSSSSSSLLRQKLPKAFRKEHECRLDPIPFPLLDSYNQAGPKHLRGLDSIGPYVATLEEEEEEPQQPSSSSTTTTTTEEEDDQKKDVEATGTTATTTTAPPAEEKLPQPVLILRGQHDFVTEVCTRGWDDMFHSRLTQHMTLAGCSHYGMLENEIMYGSVISSFLSDCEQQQQQQQHQK